MTADAFPYERFRAELDALCPIHRAQAVLPALRALPVGARVGGYVREPGDDRWAHEYSSTRRTRAGQEHISQHRSLTGAWSLAVDVGFGPRVRAAEIEEIARAAHGVMVALGLTALPDPDSAKAAATPVELSVDEAAAIVTIDREPPRPEPRSAESLWRRQYREAMAKRRILGVQHDLFGAPPVTHYYRLPRRPPFEIPPIETLDAKLQRIEDDPHATFGPPEEARRMAAEEKAEMLRLAANWLRVGQRVRVRDCSRSIDGARERRLLGRFGVVWRLCSPVFGDCTYVYLDPVRGERTEQIVFLAICDLEPVDG
jgi:hypothetical protein